ncbi:MAG: hypothetical protein BGO86_05715 [Chryseobacterium sp. 36-9]|nr:MAG: hypothetical protein BGO86_05715 [Chryseobacterium sp. 36-9]
MENKRPKNSKNLNIREREIVKTHIEELFLKGWKNTEISKWMKENTCVPISNKTVAFYIKKILEEHQKRRNEIFDKALTIALMKVEALERKGWELLINSENPKVRVINKTRTKGSDEVHEKTTETQERVGDIRILEFLRQCNLDRLEILTNANFNIPKETEKKYSQLNFQRFDVCYRAVELPPIEQNIN